jgi:hypothetical protein
MESEYRVELSLLIIDARELHRGVSSRCKKI